MNDNAKYSLLFHSYSYIFTHKDAGFQLRRIFRGMLKQRNPKAKNGPPNIYETGDVARGILSYAAGVDI
ncbi:hypothetical protein C922_04758 [Plasmodium inui San Antonio 1]|uniref:Uncharacterized protein n=1 Tax=Plasmodium inui San Antonio 1 TaxID=1237626 RepID=W7A722_9APIC|nr:hypothetical protein C922_04758 [Plasmodium inui San Antonio 1]EUD64914.1 hypothetical protein C922_04758 [Plasmodium inui San Antonio 1]